MTHSHHANSAPELSVVATAYNEEEVITRFCREVCEVLTPLGLTFEVVVVDDGSSDHTLDELRRLRLQDERIHYVSLSRNFGSQGGFVAGLEQCRARGAVITMDTDLQHPPSLLPEMIHLWQAGYDVVNTFQHKENEAGLSRTYILGRRLFHRLFTAFTGLNLARGQNEFCLMDRNALQALLAMPEHDKYLRGMTAWIGFRQTGITYRLPTRAAGYSKFAPRRLPLIAMDSILSFSRLPLWLFTVFGLILSLGALAQILFTLEVWVQVKAAGATLPQEWSISPIAITLFLGGAQLAGLGILGEYVGHILRESKRRPVYLIRESTLPQRDTRSVPRESPPARHAAASVMTSQRLRPTRSRLPTGKGQRHFCRRRTSSPTK
ncbi:MAG: glycosyltransferase family 2 protein [Magnetococcales bacterium]|nr:glycosyltransferase family 2 protein [Magnetococcales bacterium]MBF0322462.1 glycosyltransferase family 2 protein [Magnetococcales bacterium]